MLDPLLSTSVLSSSSTLAIPDLWRELSDACPTPSLDLFLLRPSEIESIRKGMAEGTRVDFGAADLLIDHFEAVRDSFVGWLASSAGLGRGPVRVAAFATYFPNIASMDDAKRGRACLAVAQAVRLAVALGEAGKWAGGEAGWTVEPCVEIVCGCLLKPSPSGSDATRVARYTDAAKQQRLLDSLCVVRDSLSATGHSRYALALELEPGPHFVMRDTETLLRICEELDKKGLGDMVGLNVDIMHYRIARVHPDVLTVADDGPGIGQPRTHMGDRIVHAHIADQAEGMHTVDQPLSRFTDVVNLPSPFCPWLRVLRARGRRWAGPGRGGLLYSGSVALELEGCDRIDWIHDSLPALSRLLRRADV